MKTYRVRYTPTGASTFTTTYVRAVSESDAAGKIRQDFPGCQIVEAREW